MAFLSGRTTYLRFKVNGPNPRFFGEEHTDRLIAFQAGRQKIATADGIEAGWSGGDHVLDTDFTLEKNLVNEALLFDLRIDTDKLPTDLLRAYTAIELKALSARNPSGFASARQKREAKEAAQERLEQDSKDGRYRKRKCIPVMWDCPSNEVLFGATSLSQVDRLVSLFQQTFGYDLEALTAGRMAYRIAELHERTRNVDDATASPYIPNNSPTDLAWIADDTSRDFLGNEFLLWLWYYTDIEGDTLTLSDQSEAVIMLARTLNLECPRGQTGHETISHEGPTRLPEARRAIQSGKLPRKVGLTIVRHDLQYELTLHAETLGVGGGKLPPIPDNVTAARARMEERITQVRGLIETLDLIYDAFGQVRFSAEWDKVLPKMQKWLAKEAK